MNTCATCEYWGDVDGLEKAHPSIDIADCRLVTDDLSDLASIGCLAAPGVRIDAWLSTKADFGCVHHKPATP